MEASSLTSGEIWKNPPYTDDSNNTTINTNSNINNNKAETYKTKDLAKETETNHVEMDKKTPLLPNSKRPLLIKDFPPKKLL